MTMQSTAIWDYDFAAIRDALVASIATRQPGLRIGDGQEARLLAEVFAERSVAQLSLYEAGLLALIFSQATGPDLDEIAAEEGIVRNAGETDAQLRARLVTSRTEKGTGSAPFNRNRVTAVEGVRDAQSDVNNTTGVISYYVLQDLALAAVTNQQPGFPSDSIRAQALAALQAEPQVEGMLFATPQPTVTPYFVRVVAVHDPDETTVAALTTAVRADLVNRINSQYALGEPVHQLELQRCLYVGGVVSGEVYLGLAANPTTTADLPANGTPVESKAYYCPLANIALAIT